MLFQIEHIPPTGRLFVGRSLKLPLHEWVSLFSSSCPFFLSARAVLSERNMSVTFLLKNVKIIAVAFHRHGLFLNGKLMS